MKRKDLLSIADLHPGDVEELISLAIEGKRKPFPPVLSGRSVALLFEKPSLRTRVSFELAVRSLGGHALYLSPDEVGLGKREPAADVARVLDRFVQGVIARTFAHETLEVLSKYVRTPVVNALSDWEHPCQALADLLTIQEKLGRLKGVTIAYIGDGNNVANSLLLAAAFAGMDFIIASPKGYELNTRVSKLAREYAVGSGGKVTLTTSPEKAVANAEVVYTDVWTSMGQEEEADRRRAAFTGYQVNEKLLANCRKPFIVMHPLPAHYGEEVAKGLLDKAYSVVFDEAENRLHMQKAVLFALYSQFDSKKAAPKRTVRK